MSVKLTCCASPSLKADFTVWLKGVPFELDAQDGPQYDGTEADYSEGWDFSAQPEAYCSACHALYRIDSDEAGEWTLTRIDIKEEAPRP